MTVRTMSLRDKVIVAVHDLLQAHMTDFGSQAVYDKLDMDYPEEVTMDPAARYVFDEKSDRSYLIGHSHHGAHTDWVWVAPLYADKDNPIVPDWSEWEDAEQHADLIIRQFDNSTGLISTVEQIMTYMTTERD